MWAPKRPPLLGGGGGGGGRALEEVEMEVVFHFVCCDLSAVLHWKTALTIG